MLNKVEEIVIVCRRNDRYSLYNKDLGIYVSAYDNYNTAVEHANKENIRMSIYRIAFDIK